MKVISASLAKWKFKIQIKIRTEIQREIRIAYKCSHMKVVKASKLSVTITLEWSGHIYPLSSENGKHKYIQCEVFVFGISLLIIQTIQPPREEQKIHWSFDIYSNESALSCDLWYMCIHYVCCKAPTHLHEELPLVCHPILFLPLGFNFSLLSLKVKRIPLHLESKFDKIYEIHRKAEKFGKNEVYKI